MRLKIFRAVVSMEIVAVFLTAFLPWMDPFSSGPSPAVSPLLFTWACVAVFLQVIIFMRPSGDIVLVSVAGAWLAAALLSSIISLVQYFGISAAFAPWTNVTPIGEAFANLRQRNQFASLTNIGMAALWWWTVRHKARLAIGGAASQATPVNRPIAAPMTMAILLAVGNAASSSRTGLFQLVLLSVMFVVWERQRRTDALWISLVAVLAYSVAAFVLPRLAGLDPTSHGMLARLREGAPACASRLTLWSNVLHLIAQKPWFGWGWGELDYAHFITLYPGPRFCDILDNAHNLPLHLAVELGLPVALLACGVGVWLLWQCKPWREVDPTRQLAWAVLAVIMLHSMLEYPLWYGPFQIATGLCIWLLWSTGKAARAGPPNVANAGNLGLGLRSAPARVMLGCLCMLLLAGVAYAAWDYHRVSQIYLAPSIRSPAYRENTLEKISGSWLFRNQVLFAELTTTEVSIDNAARIHDLALQILHFSPEARVAEKLIESAAMLGRDDEVTFFRARYRAAFPVEYARWVKKTKGPLLEKQSPGD